MRVFPPANAVPNGAGVSPPTTLGTASTTAATDYATAAQGATADATAAIVTATKLVADFSNATLSARYVIQTSTTNGNTIVNLVPNGSATTTAFQALNNSDRTAALAYTDLRITSATVQLTSSAANGGSALPVQFSVNGNVSTLWDTSGNVRLGIAVATNATDGFPYIPANTGAPSGTPTAKTGFVPIYYDTTNNKLYVYNGAWKSVTLS